MTAPFGDVMSDYSYTEPGEIDQDQHETGMKNSGGYTSRIPVNIYMWLIVVGALALLWAMYFSLGPLKNLKGK